MHAPKILKSHVIPKTSESQQLNILDTLPKSHLTALRIGFLLQKELGLPISNKLLAEYLYIGRFPGSKNAMHHQFLDESISTYRKQNSRIPGKQVTFQAGLVTNKPDKMVQINVSTLLASSWFGTSFKELSLAKND